MGQPGFRWKTAIETVHMYEKVAKTRQGFFYTPNGSQYPQSSYNTLGVSSPDNPPPLTAHTEVVNAAIQTLA